MEEIKVASTNVVEQEKSNDRLHALTGGLFLASITGVSVVCGFATTLAMLKKRDPHLFGKGLLPSRELPESGASLAARALARGTLYSVSGFGVLCLAIWKMTGANTLQEFREKMQGFMPTIPRSKNSGRSDFESVRELIEYVGRDDSTK